MKKYFLFFVAALCLAWNASAYDFVAVNSDGDSIWYNITYNDTTTVEVTYKDYYNGGYSGSITIPSTVTYQGRTYSVTAIGYNAFENCSGLTAVIIGNSVTSIQYYAFYGCSGLDTVTIPNSVTSIGGSAFLGTALYKRQQ